MSRSTYISQNLTKPQITFLKLLDAHEVAYFSLEDIEYRLGQKLENLNEIVENLAAKELLDRIERGKYTRPNFKEPYVLGTFITPRKSAVAYWSALNFLGLTTRFSNTIFIKTTSQKRSKRLFGVDYKFIQVKSERFIGIEERGYGNYRFPITNMEMTIVDCFDQPKYGGEFPELISAFSEAELDQHKLISYTKTYNNISLIKRIGFLAELLEKQGFSNFISYALDLAKGRYVLLDAQGSNSGPFDGKWKLRLNILPENIKHIIRSPY